VGSPEGESTAGLVTQPRTTTRRGRGQRLLHGTQHWRGTDDVDGASAPGCLRW
jgi:hypothetical protein